MISPRLNFSLIKPKFCELAPAIDKQAHLRQRRADIIRLVSVHAGASASVPAWKVDSRSFFTPHGFNHLCSCGARRFWNRPLLQDSTWTRPGAPEHSCRLIKFHHLFSFFPLFSDKKKKSILIQPRAKQTGYTGTEGS